LQLILVYVYIDKKFSLKSIADPKTLDICGPNTDTQTRIIRVVSLSLISHPFLNFTHCVYAACAAFGINEKKTEKATTQAFFYGLP